MALQQMPLTYLLAPIYKLMTKLPWSYLVTNTCIYLQTTYLIIHHLNAPYLCVNDLLNVDQKHAWNIWCEVVGNNIVDLWKLCEYIKNIW